MEDFVYPKADIKWNEMIKQLQQLNL
jgi:hypothetical protein